MRKIAIGAPTRSNNRINAHLTFILQSNTSLLLSIYLFIYFSLSLSSFSLPEPTSYFNQLKKNCNFFISPSYIKYIFKLLWKSFRRNFQEIL